MSEIGALKCKRKQIKFTLYKCNKLLTDAKQLGRGVKTPAAERGESISRGFESRHEIFVE